MNVTYRFLKVVFVISFIAALCIATDNLMGQTGQTSNNGTYKFRHSVYNQLFDLMKNGVEKKGNTYYGVYFVWEPGTINCYEFAYFPYNVFKDDADAIKETRDDGDYFRFYFLLYSDDNNSEKLISVTVNYNKNLSDSISNQLADDRYDRFNSSGKTLAAVDAKNQLETSSPFKACKAEFSTFFSTLNELTNKIFEKIVDEKNKDLRECSFNIYIYGNSITEFRLLIFDNSESNDWIGDNQSGKVGWIGDPVTGNCAEFYCINPKAFQDDDSKLKKLLSVSIEKECSFVACDQKVAYLIGSGIKKNNNGNLWLGWADFYKNNDYKFLLKKEFNKNVGKWIVIALARSDEDYWTTHFRQNPLVPYNLSNKSE